MLIICDKFLFNVFYHKIEEANFFSDRKICDLEPIYHKFSVDFYRL